MAAGYPLQIIDRSSKFYPKRLAIRLGEDAPVRLWAIGPPALIRKPKTALFCSNRCPGDAILRAMDQAQKWRDQGRCIISGFHSPVEKECLRTLLRGVQPIIICPARSLERMRIPKEWQDGIHSGRILNFNSPEQSSWVDISVADNSSTHPFDKRMRFPKNDGRLELVSFASISGVQGTFKRGKTL